MLFSVKDAFESMKGNYKAPPGILQVDVHGMTKYQAKICLESMIKRAGRSVYRIRVIHGYRGGTELRDLVRKEIAKNPKVLKMEIGLNQGETDLILCELF